MEDLYMELGEAGEAIFVENDSVRENIYLIHNYKIINLISRMYTMLHQLFVLNHQMII